MSNILAPCRCSARGLMGWGWGAAGSPLSYIMPRKKEEEDEDEETERRYPCGRIVSKPRKEDDWAGKGMQHKAPARKANDDVVLLMVLRGGGGGGAGSDERWLVMSCPLPVL